MGWGIPNLKNIGISKFQYQFGICIQQIFEIPKYLLVSSEKKKTREH